jgi:eukaryotic-like serine/threonine-protein kinase
MLAPNTVLHNRYLIVRKLGQGGMGAVYMATDQTFGSTVALKQTLIADEALRKAFEREARLLNGLRHAALPHVFDYFIENDGQFLVMQFIPGEDLGHQLKRQQSAVPADVVLKWADQLLDLLDYLHTHEPPIIHRDIKPENLKLTPRGNIILLDFGLAKGLAEQAGADGSTTGGIGSVVGYTPHYAPLEQIRGLGTDPRSDLYSLAATLYHLLTARLPADALSRADNHIHGQPDPLEHPSAVNPHVTPAVAAALLQAMALRRDDRIQSADSMRQVLRDAALRATPTVAPPQAAGQDQSPTIVATPSTRPSGGPTVPQYPQQSYPQPSYPQGYQQGYQQSVPPTQMAGGPTAQSTSSGGSAKTAIAVGAGGLLLAVFAAAGVLAFFYWPQPQPQPAPAPPVVQNNPPPITPTPVPVPAPAPVPQPAEPEQPAYPARMTATASSARAPMGGNSYAAEMAVDGRTETAWVEGGDGPGIGESITVTLPGPRRVARIEVWPGYFKNGKSWTNNNRLARVSVRFSDGRTVETTFQDDMVRQAITVGGGPISSFTITIEEVYYGGDELDTAISDISVE